MLKKNVMFKVGKEIFRKARGNIPGDPIVLEWDDDDYYEEDDLELDPDDAYMQVSGRLGSQIDLTIEGNFIDTFRSREDAEAFLTKWVQENNFFPNLWFIDDHGGVEGPLPYGDDSGPGRRNEGATYRQSDYHSAETVEGWDFDALVSAINEYIPLGSSIADVEDYIIPEEDVIDIEIYTIVSGSLGINQPDYIADLLDITLTQEDKDYDLGWEAIEERVAIVSDKLSNALTTRGIPGSIYFGHNEADGSYGLHYLVDIDDVVDLTGRDPVPSPLYDATTSEKMGSKRTALINWDEENGLLSDKEFDLPLSNKEFDLLSTEEKEGEEEEFLYEDEKDEDDFFLDVSLLDGVVMEGLTEDRSEYGNFSLFVDEVPARQIDDLDKAERLVNDASLVTTVGGRYSLEEAEDDMINIIFEAEMDETDRLLDEFLTTPSIPKTVKR